MYRTVIEGIRQSRINAGTATNFRATTRFRHRSDALLKIAINPASASPLALAAVYEGSPSAISSSPWVCGWVRISLGYCEVSHRSRAVVFIKFQARFEVAGK